MSRPAQDRIRIAALVAPRSGVLAVVLFALTACAAHGPDIDALAVDSTLTTGSIDREPPVAAAESDAKAIALAFARRAEDAAENVFDWTNSSNGARGSITQVTALPSDDARACRRFTTTRERFDGVGLLRGEACRDGVGAWHVTSLEEV